MATPSKVCATANCSNETASPYDQARSYCWGHLCAWVGCNGAKDGHDGAHYCYSHACGDLYCANAKSTDVNNYLLPYCEIHTCSDGDCTNWKFHTEDWCQSCSG